MPHIMIEYSSNLEPQVNIAQLIKDLHKTVIDSGLCEPAAVRTRALPRQAYRIADGAPENIFMQVTARLRAGRTVADRKTLGNNLLAASKEAVASLSASTPIALTVEVQEIDPDMLFRYSTLK
jgi:5-carboxymethyl-2-hydroxymuconate isomerase